MLQQQKNNNERHIFIKGFTFIEVILSVALLGILAAVAIPVGYEMQSRNELDIARILIAENIRSAEASARAMQGDSSWGIYMDTGVIALYQGASYATRTYDETTDISPAISFSGVQEFTFTKFTGYPTVTGAVTITSPRGGTDSITINEKGLVSYE